MTNKQIGQRIKSLLSQNKQLRRKIKELEKLRKQDKVAYQYLNIIYQVRNKLHQDAILENLYLQRDLENTRRQRNYYNRMVKDLRQQIKSMEENK